MAIVTIGGNIGAGKTVLATELATALGYQELHVGGIFREAATEHGMSIDEFYTSIKNDSELERKIDERQVRLMNEQSDLVAQGRLAWYFAQKANSPSINIILTVDPRIGAERKMSHGDYPEKNIEEVMVLCQKRERDERDHYRSLYGIENHLDPKHYDIVLNTSSLTEDEVFKKIFAEISKRS